MKVKNGSCIRHLSFKTLMAARKRNIIAVLAIALTALLFTSLFTIVMSINETNQNYQFRSVGGYAHGAFKDVDEDQIAVLSAHPDVKAVGVRTVLGLAMQGAFEKDYAEVSYMDDNNAKWSFSQPTVGRTPKSGNEITMDTKALELLGVMPELGAQVKVTYTLADKEQMGWDITDTFTLVGWWDYDELLSVHFLNVSKEYAQKIERKAVAGGMKPFRTDLSVMLRSSLNIENDLTRIGEDCGYSIGEEAGQLRIGVNWGYTATQVWDTLGVGGILAMLAVLILVAFTGYLVIYNIFQISVAGDIRYYGLLKTIGVTPKQLRRLIRQQALLLSALGIPVGLLLGYGVGAAAKVYFDKTPAELSLSEAALLAGIIKAPSNYAPHVNLEKSVQRRDYVLRSMADCGYITDSQADRAARETVQLAANIDDGSSGWFMDAALEEAAEALSLTMDELLSGGYRIETQYDSEFQRAADALFDDPDRFPDSAADGTPVQAALVAMEPTSGAVRALVGGRSYDVRLGLNRATGIRRSPGSAIKPVSTYAAAIDRYGLSPTSMVEDTPRDFGNGYSPGNAGGSTYGTVTLREALSRSLNVATVDLADLVGVSAVRGYAERSG